MHDPRPRLLIALFLLVTFARWSAASEYRDPSGFSLTYPEGWYAVTSFDEAIKATKGEAFPPEIKAWMEKNQFDLKTVNVMILRSANDAFLENLNVIVNDRQEVALGDRNVEAFLKAVPEQFASMGAKPEGLKGRVQKVGDNQALLLEYRITLPGAEFPLRIKQAIVPGGGKTYTVTFTAKVDTFDQYVPIFDAMLASLKVPPPTKRDFAEQLGFIFGIIIGIGIGLSAIAAVVGAVVFVVYRLIRGRKQRAPQAQDPPAALENDLENV